MRNTIYSYCSEEFKLGEENTDGKTSIEKEYVLYARIESMKVLEKAADYVIQEQWEVKIPKVNDNANAGRIRIRKITDSDGIVKYIQTSKVKLEQGEEEISSSSTEDAFEQFKKLATSGMVKKRFFYPIPNTDLKWEVDVFILSNGKLAAWCKIDLEVKDNLDKLPDLPIGFKDVIYNQRSTQTDEEKKKIQSLYNTVFLRKNEFRK